MFKTHAKTKPTDTVKLLFLRLGAIGDVVHTSNAYRAIKQAYPHAEIHYMTTKTQASLLENDPDIAQVWIVEKKDLSLGKFQRLARQLKQEKFDYIVNFQPNLKSRILAYLAGIRRQLNYKKTFRLHAVENFYKTVAKEFPESKLDKKMTLYLPEKAKDWAKEETADWNRPIIALNAGGIKSPRQGRTYPVSKWFELGQQLEQTYGATIVLTGASEDTEALSLLKNIQNSKFFAGKTTIEQNAALIGACDLMISGDSGPLHIATALDVPSIGLYGSMPIPRTGTYGYNCISLKSNLQCVPCNRRKCKHIKNTDKTYTPCMERIEIEAILEETQKLLKQ